MCGIVAIWGEENPYLVKKMLPTLTHRGPDDEGVHLGPNISLGHRRLSIIDVTRGHQPLFNEDGSIAMVCNGEVYNHRSLREKLAHHTFRTNSDSEVIVHLYEDLGPACVERLDGMFAFVLFDGERVFAARDPLGIKPLYYSESLGRWFFASEIKALMETVEDIREFPNGHFFHSAQGFQPYYALPGRNPHVENVEEACAGVRDLFEKAVVKRLMADVPLGVLLSGGIDSSLVSAVAARHKGGLNSFSVGMEGGADLEAARIAADHLGVNHHEYIYTMNEALEILPTVIYHLESYDAPLVRSAIPTYFVSRLARQYVKVILSGEGADELFAGYHYYKNCPDDAMLHDELVRSVDSLHNINLQRLDRLSMAHSLEARVPFLDRDLVEYALQICPSLKIHKSTRTEKWILRKALEDLLPESIIWRVKTQFATGCGSAESIKNHVEDLISDDEFEDALRGDPLCRARSKEELFYYRIFAEHFGNQSVLESVGRWEEKY